MKVRDLFQLIQKKENFCRQVEDYRLLKNNPNNTEEQTHEYNCQFIRLTRKYNEWLNSEIEDVIEEHNDNI